MDCEPAADGQLDLRFELAARLAAGTGNASCPAAAPAVSIVGPQVAFARGVLIEELDAALDELPDEQREVFIAHELMGYSFKELAAQSGVRVNTLLSRKHYAVVHLRQRLQAIYDEFTKS